MTYYHQNLWQKTKELCLKMLSIQPEYSTAYFLLGQILFYTLNYDKAIAAYENFLSFSKSSSLREVALMNMAWAYHFYRDFDKSIELAQQIIDYDLNNIGTTITLVHSYFDKGEFTSAWSVGLEAIKTLELYLRNNPDREDIKFKLEHLKFCMQMIEHTNLFLDKLNEPAQEQVNLSIPSYIEIANAIKHQQAGNLKLATSHCLQALNLDPNNSLAHLDIGLIYESQGEVEMAMSHWQKAILSNKKQKISSL
jgi:tetratricopeptide (TPR) repeat protein